jgi:hypothetical protein
LYVSQNLDDEFVKRFNITFLELNLDNFVDGWPKEIGSRELLASYVVERFTNRNFILSDVDEIPSKAQLLLASEKMDLFHFSTPTTYRRANWFLQDSHKNWSRGVLGNTLKLEGKNGARMSKLPVVTMHKDNGVHLSYLDVGGNEALIKMQRVLDHGSDFSLVSSYKILELSRKYQIDHLGRARNKGFGLLKIFKAEELPPILRELFKRNPELFDFEVRGTKLSRICVSIFISTLVNQNLKKPKKDFLKFTKFDYGMIIIKNLNKFVIECCYVLGKSIFRFISH